MEIRLSRYAVKGGVFGNSARFEKGRVRVVWEDIFLVAVGAYARSM